MPTNKNKLIEFEQIQQQVVDLFRQPASLTETSDQVITLIRELRIYQDELEQQNVELKRTTRELTRLHQEYRNLYDFAPCGYVTLNPRGLITSTNHLAADLLGTESPARSPSGFSDYLPREHAEAFETAMQKAGVTGKRQSVELSLGDLQHDPVWVRIEIVADRNKNGAVTQWRMVLIDISEQIKTDIDLRFRNRALNEILNKAADGICVCYNTKEYPHVKFTHWNPRMTEIAGYTMDEINQLGWYQSMYPDPEIRKKAIDRMDAMRLGRDISVEDWRITTKGGAEKELSISTSIIRTDRERTYVIAVMREVTQQKVEVKHAHQIKKTESLSRMAGAIAHHFNNTLTVTIGNIQLAREYLAAGESITKNLDKAEHSAQNAADMAGLLLTYIGQDRSKSAPLDLAAICKTQLRLFTVSMPERIRLDTYSATSGTVIEGNRAKIEQALQALLTNACEAVSGNPRGRITVTIGTTKAADIKGGHQFPSEWKHVADKYAVFTVTDTGRGMRDETIDRIFDPFYTDKLTGRGLGLAVVLGIIKAHHGCITVESRLGVGSTFKAFFPQTTKVVTLPEERAGGFTQVVEFFGMVLLVDDNDMILDTSQALLEQLGFEVVIAHDGAEAVATFRDNQAEIRLVLSDLTMPRMNGRETLTAIRRIQHDIPFILTSGFDEARAIGSEHREQPQVFLPKPFNLRSLQEALLKALA